MTPGEAKQWFPKSCDRHSNAFITSLVSLRHDQPYAYWNGVGEKSRLENGRVVKIDPFVLFSGRYYRRNSDCSLYVGVSAKRNLGSSNQELETVTRSGP